MIPNNGAISTVKYVFPPEAQMNSSPASFSIDVSLADDDVVSGSNITAELTIPAAFNSSLIISGCDNGVTASIVEKDDGIFVSTLKTNGNAGEFCVTLSGETESSDELDYSESVSVYIYSDGANDCISCASMDDARSKFFINHLATEEELILLGIKEAPNNFSPSISKLTAELDYANIVYNGKDITTRTAVTTGAANSGKIKVDGNVVWYDENEKEHPLEDALVKLLDDDFYWEQSCGETYTDEFGNFSFETENQTFFGLGGRDLYVAVYATSKAAAVGSQLSGSYRYCTTKYVNVPDNTNIHHNIEIHPGSSDRANAFEICQAEKIPYDYVNEMDNTDLPQVTVFYPCFVSGGSYYFWALDYMSVAEEYYRDWDCLNHEYGHYINNKLGLCEVDIAASHRFGQDLINDLGKKDGLKLAMSEGLASYLGTAAQLYYAEKYDSFPRVGDEFYYSVNKAKANYDLYRCGQSLDDSGEGSEISVTSVLIKLLDDADRTGDNVSLGHERMWKALRSACHKNISELICTILSQNESCRSDIGKILEYEAFSPSVYSENNLTLSVDQDDSCWTFTWRKSGFPLGQPNRFNLVFEGESGDSFTIENISDDSITLNASQINSVLSLSGAAVKWHVVSYNDDSPATGGYMSGDRLSSKPSSTILPLNSASSDVLESGKTKWFKFTAPYSGTYYFESNSDMDLCGELFSSFAIDGTYTNRIAYDDDGGTDKNFKVSTTLSPGETIYLRVRGYNYGTSICGAFSISASVVHTHSYSDHFLKYSALKHKAYCSCGSYVLKQHVANVGSSVTKNGHIYSNCADCGALIDLGSTPSVIE